jgi:UDP-N-acetylmuramyl pentapeptide phosphotransferase/UDP-N-acetylglucosamine-1-phosphate transferase
MSAVALAAALLLSLGLSAFLSRYRGRYALLDLPNARSLHSGATPRSGGLAILAGIVAAACIAGVWAWLPQTVWVAAAFLLVAAVSFADDLWRLPPLARLLVHLTAVGLLVLVAGYMPVVLHLLPGWQLGGPQWVLASFCILLSAWLVNLYNFMDGMDGLAGGMALIGFGTLALLGLMVGSPTYALAAALVAAAAVGFLPFNFPPARLFMGDVGSGSLGFLVAVFLLWAERAGLFPLWLGLLVFSPFLVDSTWTLARRALHGRKPWAAHREHFYQRLVHAGWNHRRTTLWAYALMLKSALFAALCIHFAATTGVQGLLLGWMTLTYLSLIAYVNVLERRASK